MSLFGTDGVRGLANTVLTPDLALKLGRAAGLWMKNGSVVIGRDTRLSGTMLESALAAGFNSAGIHAICIGVIPTPGVSYVARTGDFKLGAVISASHNPAEDNGIKFLGHNGRKLSDADEEQIEALLDTPPALPGDRVGETTNQPDLTVPYTDWLAEQLQERLAGFTLALDCANGAASFIAPHLFRRLGADVIALNHEPDGLNINKGCGATHPKVVQELTQEVGAQLGIAFDGDADRCVFSDERGNLINGDRTMGIWASYWSGRGELSPPTIVGTVMSNMGFEHALNDLGVNLERTSVGDRYVVQRMDETGAKVGGEQSGHIVFSDLTPTGDGILTAIELLRVLRKSGCAASELPPLFDNWPQLLVNVKVGDRTAWAGATDIHALVAELDSGLGDSGRIVVRASGTQPMIRVMVEAKDQVARDSAAALIVDKLASELGGSVQGRVELTHALGD